ncbi:hypothetical protein [Methylobrevis albus]|uniref:Flagellar protein FlgN n=1 Tax=Methylobrevis albus TaxID=2793297 RepID=A0A931HZB2_9HYPH|nr:hypothetical protein [Methylobrevis albus]MBH0236862.1 hypothetical protein [Methylobrevis albus]
MTDPTPADLPVTSQVAARALIDQLDASIVALSTVIDEETDLVRAGRLKAAAAMAARKQECSDVYVALMLRAQREVAALGRLAPVETQRIRKRHHLLQADLQINLAVLATAHQVAEDLMRAVAREVEGQRTPQTYGRPATAAARAYGGARGIALDRSL